MVKPRETFGSKFAVLATMVGLAVDERGVVMTHEDGGVSVWNLTDLTNGNAPWESGTTSDVPADATGEVAIHNRTAYLASEGGLLRLDLDGGPAWLTSWGSTGIDQSFYAPIVEYQGVLHYGLYGYGVVRIDLASGELLEPLLDGNGNGASAATTTSSSSSSAEWAERWEREQWERKHGGASFGAGQHSDDANRSFGKRQTQKANGRGYEEFHGGDPYGDDGTGSASSIPDDVFGAAELAGILNESTRDRMVRLF